MPIKCDGAKYIQYYKDIRLDAWASTGNILHWVGLRKRFIIFCDPGLVAEPCAVFTAKCREVSKPQDISWELSDLSQIWLAARPVKFPSDTIMVASLGLVFEKSGGETF